MNNTMGSNTLQQCCSWLFCTDIEITASYRSIDTYSPAFESTFQWTNNNTSLHIKQNDAMKLPFLGSRHCSDPTPLECTILSCLCEFSKIIAWYPFFNTFPIEWCILIFWPVGTPHHHLLPWPTAIPVSSLHLLQSCSDRPLHAFHNNHYTLIFIYWYHTQHHIQPLYCLSLSTILTLSFTFISIPEYPLISLTVSVRPVIAANMKAVRPSYRLTHIIYNIYDNKIYQ